MSLWSSCPVCRSPLAPPEPYQSPFNTRTLTLTHTNAHRSSYSRVHLKIGATGLSRTSRANHQSSDVPCCCGSRPLDRLSVRPLCLPVAVQVTFLFLGEWSSSPSFPVGFFFFIFFPKSALQTRRMQTRWRRRLDEKVERTHTFSCQLLDQVACSASIGLRPASLCLLLATNGRLCKIPLK